MSPGVALPFVFALSGAAGLIFEVVWFERCGLVFGNSVVAAAIVLSSFMAGQAVGTAGAVWLGPRITRRLRLYAALEAAVAVAGIALTAALPRLVGDRVPLPAAFVLLLLPASAMGATLPILVGALRAASDREAGFGWALGTMYGWNTCGAVAGALLVETALMRDLGVTGSAWFAAALDGLAAGSALAMSRGERLFPTAPDAARSHGHSGPSTAAFAPAAAAFLSGGAFLALEVIWFRFLSMFVLTTTLAMSVMLAVVLAGIALGGLLAARVSRGGPRAVAFVPLAALLAGIGVVLSYAAFNRLTSGVQVGNPRTVAWFAAVMAVPVSVASGALFTWLGEALARTVRDETRAAAILTMANTVGAAIGPALAAFVLLPALGTERTLFAVALGYGVIALIAASRAAPGRLLVGLIAFLVVIVRFPFGLMESAYLPRVAAPYAADGSQIVATREGPAESILLMQQLWMGRPVYNRLVTNGFSMSGTAIPGQRYMRYFVYWPMLMHQEPLRRLLIVGYGVGVTAGAAVDVPSATSIDIVELSRDILSMSDRIYAGGGNPLRDPRVQVHIEDGRHFLQTTAGRFDLITGEPPPPRTPGAVNIYTREYFGLIRDRLADGGFATYWLPVARPSPGTDIDTVVRAFCDVFADCSLWNATPFDFMLVGSRGAHGSFAPARFEPIADRFRDIGFETPDQIGATFLGDASFLRELTADTPPLTDDFPQRLRPVRDRPSLSDPRYPGDPAVVARYQHVLDPGRARDAFAASAFVRERWPPPLLLASRPWFDDQAMINRVLWEGGKPMRLIDDLDTALRHTTLRTLPLWIMDSDAVKERIAAAGNDGTGLVEYVRGVQLMVDREYPSAASYFGLAERRGLRAAPVRPMLAYALCLAGRVDLSRQVARTIQPEDADARRFLDWMAAHCN